VSSVGALRLAAGAIVSLLLATTSACAPGTPDADSWRIDAQRAVSNASSAVSTAELALRQHVKGRIFDRYLQTVMVEAEKGMGKASNSISTRQPPPSERVRYQTVTSEIDGASSLVASARIAVVDRQTDRYDALASRLAKTNARLQKLEGELMHPPRAQG
jgi:hypothetical protein